MVGAKLKLFIINCCIFSSTMLNNYVLFPRNCIEFITNIKNDFCGFFKVSLNNKSFLKEISKRKFQIKVLIVVNYNNEGLYH